MKWIHILAGALALVSGAVALYATKGSTLHRRSGMLFAIAMLVMTSSAVLIAAFLSPNRLNVVAGLVTFYLVGTGLLTVLRPVEQVRALSTVFMLLALATSLYAFALGIAAAGSASGRIDGMPPQPLFMFAVIALLGGLLDARMLWARSLQGAHRLARHLWRMGFAMWIATASFFLGQAKLFPDAIRASGVLAIPVVAVLLTLLYWLVRVLRRRRNPAALPTRANGTAQHR